MQAAGLQTGGVHGRTDHKLFGLAFQSDNGMGSASDHLHLSWSPTQGGGILAANGNGDFESHLLVDGGGVGDHLRLSQPRLQVQSVIALLQL